MAKAYTDLEQSKKLAEILLIESADMCYRTYREKGGIPDYQVTLCPYKLASWVGVPCWSLAALLRELPDTMLGKDKDGYVVMVETMGSGLTAFASNPIDACYDMILKLHEQKKLL